MTNNFNLNSRIAVTGIMSQTGQRYFDIIVNHARIIISAAEAAKSGLIEQRFSIEGVMITPAQKRTLFDLMSEVSSFEQRLVATAPGWTGPHYLLADGTCFSPAGQDRPEIAFVLKSGKNRYAGTSAEWREQVAIPLTGQTLLMCLIMLTFVGPLLRFSSRDMNILMELHGAPGTGKTTWLRIVATCLGAASGKARERYPVSLNGTSNAIEEDATLHNDSTLIADEAQLYSANLASVNRAKSYKELVFRLSEGTSKARWQGDAPVDFRIVALFGTNEGVAQVTGGDAGTTQRLLTLPVDGATGLGALEFVPPGFDSAAAFIGHITKASCAFYGTPIRTYLDRLVPLIAADESAFREKMEMYVLDFYAAVSVDKNSGESVRIAEPFALAAVAGRLAIRFGVLPTSWNPTAVAADCYHRHLANVRRETTVLDQLRAHARRSDVLRTDKKSPRIDAGEWQACVGLVIDQGGPEVELLIPTHAIKSVFPAWASIKRTAAVSALLRKDKDGHLASQRRLLASGKKPRVYAFTLPR